MKRLLNLLNHEYPLVIADTALCAYLSQAMSKDLFGRHLFVSHSQLASVTCPRCFQMHEVLMYEAMHEDFYYLCNQMDGGLEVVKAAEIRRWRFDLDCFLRLIIKQLKIKNNMRTLVPAVLWQLGTVGIEGTEAPVVCLFCRKSLRQVIRHLPRNYDTEKTAILYVGEVHLPQATYANLACIELSQFLDDGATGLQLDQLAFRRWLTRVFQRVFFDTRNGDLIIDGLLISNALPASPQYFFLRCLWEQFNVPVRHEDIFAYCCRELARRDGIAEWRSEYLPSAFCHTMKRLLKQPSLHKDLCDEAIQSTRTLDEQNAYRLTIPSKLRSPPLDDSILRERQKGQ